MKRIILISNLYKTYKLLLEIESNLINKRITYIPTASKIEKLGFVINFEKYILKKIGLIVDELDISKYDSSKESIELIRKKIKENDYIYITGGNTFYLLQELKRTKTNEILIEEINNGKLYIGESAGGVILSNDIYYVHLMDNIKKAPLLKEYSGLKLINFYFLPHYKTFFLGPYAKKIINTYSDTLDLKIINDKKIIYIKDNDIIVKDKKNEKKFNL